MMRLRLDFTTGRRCLSLPTSNITKVAHTIGRHRIISTALLLVVVVVTSPRLFPYWCSFFNPPGDATAALSTYVKDIADYDNWGNGGVWNYAVANTTAASETATNNNTASSSVANLDYDLSVIITSNLIPTHPSIWMINQTIASLSRLEGITYDVPVYITIDGIKPPAKKNRKTANKEAAAITANSENSRRSEYIHRLKSASFVPFTNIHVLEMNKHRHISGSVNEALKYLLSNKNTTTPRRQFAPSEHFIYLLQHDLNFVESVPHNDLVQALREYPRDLKNVRFRLNKGPLDTSESGDRKRFPPCPAIENGTVFERNGLSFFGTTRWSDNNQLGTLQYYLDMISLIQNTSKGVRLDLAMEDVLDGISHQDCEEWGQVVLGDRTERLSYLGHLDGRLTKVARHDYNVTTLVW